MPTENTKFHNVEVNIKKQNTTESDMRLNKMETPGRANTAAAGIRRKKSKGSSKSRSVQRGQTQELRS